MDRRQFLLTAAASSRALSAQTQPRQRRNVLLLIADDLGLHTGAYGDANAKTPNLDRLASEGVRFTNAFCTTASCSASRGAILSGLHTHANGQYGHEHAEHHMSYLPFVKPLPRLLKDAGYRTGVVGKLHVGIAGGFGWDLDKQGNQRNVHGMAETAREFMQASGSQPWYLHVGFGDPHRARKGFANGPAYPNVTDTRFDPQRLKLPSYLPDNQPTSEEVAEYYQAANRLDQGIGFFLDALKSTGQLDNTLVVFISDNGMPFPNAKTNFYDAGVHLPMIVRSPEQAKRGLVNQAMVSWVDLTPTFLDWTGAKGPDYPLHGRSFLRVLEQENPSGWEEVYFSHTFHEITMYYPMRAVRTKKYKYIRNLHPELEFPHASDLWGSKTWQSVRREGTSARIGQRPVESYLHRAAEELYDIERDPNELTNLAGKPEHKATLAALHEKVHNFRRRTKDPWTINNTYQGEEPGDNELERELSGMARSGQAGGKQK